MIQNGRWPSVQKALVAALYAQFGYGSTRIDSFDELPVVQVTRLGGFDDGKTDSARIQVIVVAADEDEAETLAEDIRHYLVDTRPIRGAGLLLDGATTEVAPHRVPYPDPQVSEYLAVYVVTARRG